MNLVDFTSAWSMMMIMMMMMMIVNNDLGDKRRGKTDTSSSTSSMDLFYRRTSMAFDQSISTATATTISSSSSSSSSSSFPYDPIPEDEGVSLDFPLCNEESNDEHDHVPSSSEITKHENQQQQQQYHRSEIELNPYEYPLELIQMQSSYSSQFGVYRMVRMDSILSTIIIIDYHHH